MTRAERRHNTRKVINKRKDLLGINWNKKYTQQPHRLAKYNGVNCGNPKCIICANPRKMFKQKTLAEKSFHQKCLIEMETYND